MGPRTLSHGTPHPADPLGDTWQVEQGAMITPENIRLLNRFTGLLDEEWFLKVQTTAPHRIPSHAER